MLVSVIVCTWNRARLLEATLREMLALRVPAGVTWELIVVNNNCSDTTDEVLARYSTRLPLQRLFEPNQGLSHARNLALAEAQGELLLWLDDDVLVDPYWLVEYVKARAAHSGAAFFGGTIEPEFSVKPPRWIKRNTLAFLSAYALKNPPDEALISHPDDDIPIGANMGVLRGAFQDFRFSPDLGRCGDKLLSGEEEHLFKTLLHGGSFGLWVPSARVRHYIPTERLTRRYLWNYYHGFGETQVKIRQFSDSTASAAALRGLRREYLNGVLKTSRLSLARDLRWAAAFQSTAIAKGKLDALRANIRSSR